MHLDKMARQLMHPPGDFNYSSPVESFELGLCLPQSTATLKIQTGECRYDIAKHGKHRKVLALVVK